MDSEKIYLALMKRYAEKYLDKFMKEEYHFYSPEEIKVINKTFKEVADDNFDSVEDEEVMAAIVITKEIIKAIIEEEDIENVNLEGYLMFRMKKFIPHIETIVDMVAELIMLEDEFEEEQIEIMDVLRDLYLAAEPMINKMMIKMESEEHCIILDEKGKNIEKLVKSHIDAIVEIMGDKATYSDRVLGAILTIAPKEIILVNPSKCDHSLLTQLVYIFREKISLVDLE